jgi:DNA-binding MarR family transcriptional regulator
MDIPALSSSLRSVISGLHKSLRRQMSEISSYSMTEVETIALLSRHASMLPTQLAAMTRIKAQSMSQILHKLEAQGLIKRSPSTDDKRKVYISLTNTGKKMVDKVRYDKDERLKEAIEKLLTDKERALLAKALPVLNKLIEIK